MSKKTLILTCTFILAMTSTLFADAITNGGFETGDTTGWTITGDHSVISSFTPQFIVTDASWSAGIPFYGTYTLMLGSGDVGYVQWDLMHWSLATQTGQISQTDVDNGLHLYFKWGAILEEPTNNIPHNPNAQPYFSLELSSGATTLYYADHRADQGGFALIGEAVPGAFAGDIWWGTGIADVNLSALGLDLNDPLTVDLYVRDCGLGGHGGLVFLDGFGTINPSPGPGIPEPTSLLLLGTGLGVLGLAAYRRKRK